MSQSGNAVSGSVTFPTRELTGLIDDVRNQLDRCSADVLTQLGVELLDHVRDAYVVKAGGGTGSDGISWDAIQVRSLRRRGRRHGLAKKSQGAKRTPQLGSTGDPRRKIGPSAGAYEIGRDTGRQLASLQPGTSGDGGESLTVDRDSVTVRARLSYSPYFDQQRPIMPETVPTAWLDDLERIVLSHGEKVLSAALDRP